MRQIWVGCILLSTAVSSAAVTLGRHSGAAVIGRPLDVRVQVLLAPGEDIGGLCIGSDVFYGDAQVPGSQVRSTPQKTTAEAEGFVRIQSFQAVNEPIVTVYVRAGCNTPFTRRFVLLADPITEPAVQPAPTPATDGRVGAGSLASPERLPSVNAALAGGTAAGARGLSDAAPAAIVGEQQAVRAPSARPLADVQSAQPVARPPKPKAPSVVRRPVVPPAENTPRLQLEAVDLSLAIERDPVLKMSISLLSEPTTSDETRAAAALLWKAINASPEEILSDAQKLSVLETESKGLRDAENQSKAAIAELSSNLEAAKAERYMNWLVYLLGAALLLALMALAALWRRRDQASGADAVKAWWASEGGNKAEKAASKAAPEDLDVDLDLDLDLGRESSFGAYKRGAASAKGARKGQDSLSPLDESAPAPLREEKEKRDFAPSMIGASRSVATEELFDVQQQADFFVSLGEDEQAIQVLRSHLIESHEPSALAYLDLLKIYHRLGRKADYERSREEFNHVFNAGAPPFDQYSDESLGLEAYETAFGRIQALWPQPRVLDVIEQSIFRDPNDPDSEVFDLEAYRELLLLHAMAKDMIKRDVAAAHAPNDFQHTAVQPLKAAGKLIASAEGAGGRDTEPFDTAPPASPRLGLDVDLNDLSEFSAFEASLPEVSVLVEPTAQPEPPPRSAGREPMDNLIDFEMLDFMTDEDVKPAPKPSDKA